MPNRKKKRWVNGVEWTWRVLRPVFVVLTALLLTLGIVSTLWQYVYSNYLAPVDPQDNEIVVVEIPSGSSLSGIARTLQRVGIVRNKGVFQYTAELLDCASKLKAGTYELSRSMTNKEILERLMMGDGGQRVVTFTLTEGLGVEEMAARLVEEGILKDTARFLELCRTGEGFAEEYDFIQAVLDGGNVSDRSYVLEGYLFPDTYEIYAGASEESIIDKMLARTREVYVLNYIDRAEVQGYSMDQVITLASIIEKEAKTSDFSKVSAVFYNRLKAGMRLESDATVKYVLKISDLALDTDDLSVVSPYNTYANSGLPAGPIGNPGRNAIEAVLYPDEAFVEEGYYYFCTAEPTNGELVFAKTLQEHQANVEKYRTLWQLWDTQNKEDQQQ